MKKEEDKVLLLSKYILDVKPYHEGGGHNITWKTSSIRKWLNNDFYTTVFNDVEQKKIADTLIKTEINSKYENIGEDNTEDKVFLLSEEEAESLFMNDEERKAKTTEYAKKKGIYIDKKTECSRWWLRSLSKSGGVLQWMGSL